MFAFVLAVHLFLGDHTKGEIEIVVEPEKVAAIEKSQKERWIRKGYSEEEAARMSKTGIVAEDSYWIWERDPVLFPSSASGTYNCLRWRGSEEKPMGAAVLPILPNGKFVLNVNFRHATRSWELELPRGMLHPKESPEMAAQRELKEETGLEAKEVSLLGMMAPDTGVLNSVVPVYAGWVEGEGSVQHDESEAIAGTQVFTFEELQKALKQGYVEIEPQGKVFVRDSFLTFALFQYISFFDAENNSTDNTSRCH